MHQQRNRQLLDLLNKCAIECSHCAMACLEEEDVKMLAPCVRINLDCAEICRVLATLLSRGSVHGNHLLNECAEVCTKCADECSMHTQMEHCKVCAAICRECSSACTEMKEAVL